MTTVSKVHFEACVAFGEVQSCQVISLCSQAWGIFKIPFAFKSLCPSEQVWIGAVFDLSLTII